jgi:hypothetical protein
MAATAGAQSGGKPPHSKLHGDGVVGVAGYVPAGAIAGVGEEGVGAGEVFFRVDGVDLIFDFVVFFGDGQHADAVDGAGGWAKLGETGTQRVPRKVD